MSVSKPVYKKINGEWVIQDAFQRIDGEWVKISSAVTADQLSRLIDGTITEVTAEDLEGLTEFGNYAFSYCDELTSVIMPDTITDIGTSTFFGCSSLKNVVISNSATSVGSSAFNGCALTEVTIPSSVIYFNFGAFYNCTALKTIKMLPTTPPTINQTSAILTNLTRIEVPSASLSAYQTAEEWSDYASIMVGV